VTADRGSRGDTSLRIAVFVTTCAGIWALVAADLLPAGAGLTGGALLALAAGWASRVGSGTARKWASSGLLAVTVIAALSRGLGDLTNAGATLAILLVGLTVAHALVLESVRDLTVGLELGGAMVLVSAGLAPGMAIAAPLGVAWVSAISALVLAHDLHARRGTAAVLVAPAAPRTGGRVVRTVLAAVVVGLLVFLLVPRPPSLSDLAARSRFAGGAQGQDGPGATGRSAGAWSSGVLDMRVRGTLGDDPVLSVPGDSPGLWRGAVLDRYDGQRWSAPPGGARLLRGGPVRSVPPTVDDPAMPHETTRTDEVRPIGYYGTVVAPGRPVAVAAPVGLTVGGGRVGLASPGGYTVTSASPRTDPATLRRATGPDPSPGRWTDLPPALPGRVADLGRRLVDGAPTRYDAVRAIEEDLRARATYRLDSPVPGRGDDAVDVFLFRDRTGFCEQFAAAETVLLRAAGIPARLVTGFSGGARVDERRVIRDSDAHAWVEVWFPGVGWVPSDPTAGATLADESAGRFATAWTALGNLVADARGRLLLAVGLVCLVCAGVAVGRFARRSRPGAGTIPAPGSTGAGRRGPLPAAFGRFETALAEAGAPRLPSEGLEGLAARIPAAAAPLAVVGRALYGATAPSPADSRAAADTLDRLSAALLAAAAERSVPSTTRP
jgi:transglutaminase-like putative cysteine protease